MHELPGVVFKGWFTEQYIHHSGPVHACDGLDLGKPRDLTHAVAIGEGSGQTFLATLPFLGEVDKLTLDLYMRHFSAVEITDAVEAGAVNVLCRKILEKVGAGMYIELRGKELRPRLPYSTEELYVCL